MGALLEIYSAPAIHFNRIISIKAQLNAERTSATTNRALNRETGQLLFGQTEYPSAELSGITHVNAKNFPIRMGYADLGAVVDVPLVPFGIEDN
jgi:hypothetical protein